MVWYRKNPTAHLHNHFLQPVGLATEKGEPLTIHAQQTSGNRTAETQEKRERSKKAKKRRRKRKARKRKRGHQVMLGKPG
jgi:hypothetical protein